jgi:diketogulonate reductase-like aldo/keto reductase
MTNRRDFIRYVGAAAVAATTPLSAYADSHACLRARPIPGTDELLPVIGMGNAGPFNAGDARASWNVIRMFQKYGSRYIDCGDPGMFTVAELVREHDLKDDVFLGTYFSGGEETAARAAAGRLLRITGKPALDLMHGYADHAVSNWDTFRRFKDDELTRYIGVARHRKEYYEAMMKLMSTGTVDFVQLNYSLMETEAEERILPMARDLGVAVITNRPFINGAYFDVVRGHELPAWAAEFDCDSWAQFSLKFIVSHPAINCALTETANPNHAADNLGAGFGRLPDATMRKRMLKTIRELG